MGGTFETAKCGTFETYMPGTFHSATGGTFVPVMGGTFNPLLSCNTIEVPNFSFPEQTNRAKTIDVIWFNSRNMPDSFFEVEHTTDIQNSVTKFCDLQDFNSRFIIVAPENRRDQFEKVMNRTAFKQIRSRVSFSTYETISKQYSLMCQEMALKGRI